MKLIIDKSSIAGAFLHLEDEEFGEDITYKGNQFHIPSPETCLERFQVSFNNTLKDYDLQSMDVIAVCDPKRRAGTTTERKRILPEYKSKDYTERPPEFWAAKKEFFDLVDQWLKEQGAILATPPTTLEADDLINEFAVRFPRTLIWTRDKDMLACPTDVLLQGKDGGEINPKKFPVPDQYIHLYRALVQGDSSDGLGSCKGFGPKAFDSVLEVFGEDCLETFDELFRERRLYELSEDVNLIPKLQLVIDQAEELYKIYDCMQFFKVPAHKVKWEAGMQTGDKTLVTKDNYQEALSKLRDTNFDYSVIDFETDVGEESREWLKTTGKDDKSRIVVDVMESKICGMGLRIGYKNYYFSVDHADTDNISLTELETVLELLYDKKVYAHKSTGFENIVLYTHFGTFLPEMRDTSIMANYVDENDSTALKGLSKRWLKYDQATYQETIGDRSGMREVPGEEVLSYGIDDVITCDALQNLFTTIMVYEDTFDTFEEVEVDSAFVTSLAFIGGADFDHEIHERLQTENNKNITEAWSILSDQLLSMGWHGAKFKPVTGFNFREFNRVYEAVHGEKYTGSTAVKTAIRDLPNDPVAQAFGSKNLELVNSLYRRYWKPEATLNLRSPKQMNELLYSENFLSLPVRIRKPPTDKMRKEGRDGNPSTDEEAIKNAIAFDCEGNNEWKKKFLESLIKYKGFLTRESLFFSKYPNFVHWKTGKLHSSMRQCPTTTRRFSHSKPNLAQMSKKKGKEMRDMIKAHESSVYVAPEQLKEMDYDELPDWLLFTLDIDSQELQHQAWESQDKNFLDCYMGEVRKDVHSLTGFEVAAKQGQPYESYAVMQELLSLEDKLVKEFRAKGKATNFATAYLCKARRLANMLAIPLEDAESFIAAKAEAFPGLLPAIKRYCAECRDRGYSLTRMGARRHLHVHYAKGRYDDAEMEAADRLAWSFRIQSSAGEQIRLAMRDMWRAEVFNDGLCWPITVIHDEIVGRIHKSVLKSRMPVLVSCICRKYADMEIQVTTTPMIGTHFGSLIEYKI